MTPIHPKSREVVKASILTVLRTPRQVGRGYALVPMPLDRLIEHKDLAYADRAVVLALVDEVVSGGEAAQVLGGLVPVYASALGPLGSLHAPGAATAPPLSPAAFRVATILGPILVGFIEFAGDVETVRAAARWWVEHPSAWPVLVEKMKGTTEEKSA